MPWGFFEDRKPASNLQTDVSFQPVNISSRDRLIEEIGVQKIDLVCDNLMFVTKEQLSERFLNILKESSAFYDYLTNHYLDMNLFEKINNGSLSLNDIHDYSLDLLDFPLFSADDEKKISLLRKDIHLDNSDYVSFGIDKLEIPIKANIPYRKEIDSYMSGIKVCTFDTMVRKVEINNFDSDNLKISVLFPGKKSFYNREDAKNYMEGDISSYDGAIVVIPYNDFKNLSEEEIQMLRGANVVIKEDYNKINNISYQLFSKIGDYNYEMDENDLVKINHLLYVVSNSDLSQERKKYYSYYLKKDYKEYKNFEIMDFASQLLEELGSSNVTRLTEDFNNLSPKEKKSDVNTEEYSTDVFLGENQNIETMGVFSLLGRISLLDDINKEKILNLPLVRQKLAKEILEVKAENIWEKYERILNYLNPRELLSLYDADSLKKYFNSSNEEEYIFWGSLSRCELNETILTILDNDKLFDMFWKQSDCFYSEFNSIDYDVLVKSLKKMEQMGLPYKPSFLSSIPLHLQYELLKEKLSNKTVIYMLPHFNKEVVDYFFLNDERAKYLYDSFDIVSLVQSGVRFSRDILAQKNFFDKLKTNTFGGFRANINAIEKYNDPGIIEERVKDYYEELIGKYDAENDMFSDYSAILRNPELVFKSKQSYIFNIDVLSKLRRMIDCKDPLLFDDNLQYFFTKYDEAKKILQEQTSRKISEIVVDALIQDNIYNVQINIREMLRYNGRLSEQEKVLDEDKIKFYEMLLDFDNVSTKEKIDLFNKLKDKNINMMFYDDLRKLKDISYDHIRDELVGPKNGSENISESLSNQYGVTVYDYRDKPFLMLVRAQDTYHEQTRNIRDCYSIISNDNTDVFLKDSGQRNLYGYVSFDKNKIVHVLEKDAYSWNDIATSSSYVNRLMTGREVAESSRQYSEVEILNDRTEDGAYVAQRPDFIMCIDDVSEAAVSESKRLGIPIFLIKNKILEQEKYDDISFSPFGDRYVYSEYDEQEKDKKIK